MRRFKISTLKLGIFVCLNLMAAPSLWSQSEGAVVRSDPSLVEIVPGQVRTVEVVLENAQEVYAIEVRGAFDPSVVEVVDGDPSLAGAQLIPGDLIKPDFVVRNGADNAAGTLHYVVTQINPTEPASGSGTVFAIQFRGRPLDGQTELEIELTIDFVDIVNRRGEKLSVEIGQSTLIVVATSVAKNTTTDASIADATAVGTEDATTAPAATSTRQEIQPTVTTLPTTFDGAWSGASIWLLVVGVLGGLISMMILAYFGFLRRAANTTTGESKR